MDRTKEHSLAGRIARRIITVAGTLVIVAGSIAAIVFGADTLAARANSVPLPEAAAATPVAVQPLQYEDGYVVERTFTGQVEAGSEAQLSFELGGRILSLNVAEGDRVQEGQRIATLDTALLDAEQTRLSAARAAIEDQLIFAQSRLVRAEELIKQGFASQERVDQAVATRDELRNRMAEMDAALASVAINIEKSVLYAPFSGQVGARQADAAEIVAAGQAVVSLIETNTPEVRVGLPLSMDADAVTGAAIELGGEVFPARLLQIRPDLDPLTRTRTALFAVETDTAPIVGQTAILRVPMDVKARGAWVPIDALKEGAGSVWTILVVEENVVRSAAVELLHAEDTRAYVVGSFEDGAQMIATGAHRVVPGQTVETLTAGS